MKYNVLIVDDEFLARKLLAGYIEKIEAVQIVGSCTNAFEAFAKMKETRVDILLLDIHMPELSGMEFAKTCSDIPAIIFTTAYSEYAIDSYELNATDYLLKPIALPRFMQAMEKAMERVRQHRGDAVTDEKNPVAATLDEKGAIPAPNDFIIVKADYKLYKINYEDLLYIEGQHEYVSFYTTGKRITALYSLKSLEEVLPADRFIRVHKSYIVSLKNILEIEPMNLNVAGRKIPIGGSYKENLISRLQIK